MEKYRSLDELPLTITVEELAQILRIGRNNAYSMVQQKKIRCIHCGRKIVIPRAALIEFLETVS